MSTPRTPGNNGAEQKVRALLVELKSKTNGSAEAKELVEKITLASIEESSGEIVYEFFNLLEKRVAHFDPEKLAKERESTLSPAEEIARIRKFVNDYHLEPFFNLDDINEETRLTEAVLFGVLGDLAERYMNAESPLVKFISSTLGATTATECANKGFQYGTAELQSICMRAVQEVYVENKDIKLIVTKADDNFDVNTAFIAALEKKLETQLGKSFEETGFFTTKTPQVKSASNYTIKDLRDNKKWYFQGADEDAEEVGSPLFKDLTRGFVVNKQSFVGSPEENAYKEFLKRTPTPSIETSDQERVKQVRAFFKRVLFNENQADFDKHYPNIIKFYSQDLIYPVKQTLHSPDGESFLLLEVDFTANIAFQTDEVTLDVCTFNTEIIDLKKDGLKNPVPFVVLTKNKLTEQGFQFSHGTFVSEYIKQACLGDKPIAFSADAISDALKENSEYFKPVLAILPKSTFTDQIVAVIYQAKILYDAGKLTPISYTAIVNSLCVIAEFPWNSRFTAISGFNKLFDLDDLKANTELNKNLKAIGADLLSIATDTLTNNPGETEGFDTDLAELKEKSFEDSLSLVDLHATGSEEKNFLQRAWVAIKDFASEHPYLTSFLAILALTIITTAIIVGTLGVGAIPAAVGVGLTATGLGSTAAGAAIIGFFTATAAAVATGATVAATAIAAAVTTAVTVGLPLLVYSAIAGIDWLRRTFEKTKEPVLAKEEKKKSKESTTGIGKGLDPENRGRKLSRESSPSSSRSTSTGRSVSGEGLEEKKPILGEAPKSERKSTKGDSSSSGSSTPREEEKEEGGKPVPPVSGKSARF